MIEFLQQLPQVKILQKVLGDKARLVGGAVRDGLLGIKVSDVDVATVLKPEEVMALFEKEGVKVIPTGIKYGTVTALIDGHNVEITTLRKDVECYGRDAEVEYTDDWQEDAARRDFTMNAMSLGFDGEVYDYFSGREDLEKGCVRFVGEAKARCEEDFLRILRFFRFYAWYGKGEADKEAVAACSLLAKRIEELSGERLQAELKKLLVAADPLLALELMEKCGVMEALVGKGVEIDRLRRLVELRVDGYEDADPLLRLAALLRSGGDKVDVISDRIRLSNVDRAKMLLLVETKWQVTDDEMQLKKWLRSVGKERFVELVLLHWAEEAGEDNLFYAMLKLANDWEILEFPVKGKDLVALGMKPGKEIGKLLKKAEQWWEDGGYEADKGKIMEFIEKEK